MKQYKKSEYQIRKLGVSGSADQDIAVERI